MSPSRDTAATRGLLLSKLDGVLARTGAVRDHLRGGDGRNELDFTDRVALTENDDVLEALDDAGRAEIASLRAALHRIDQGTYGTCVRCEGAIAAGRLDAMPEAALCVDCASTLEGA